MSAYPDYTKTQFRIVVEHLTSMLAKRFRVDIGQVALYEAITELYESQVIDRGLRSDLHAIRKAGNAVVQSGHFYRFRGDWQLTARLLTDIERSANGGKGRLPPRFEYST